MKFNELSNRMFNVNHLFWFHANGILLYFIEWRFMSEKMMPKMRSKWRWPTEVTERAAFKSQSTKLVTSLFRTSVWFQSIFEVSLFVSWIDCKFAEIHSQSRYCRFIAWSVLFEVMQRSLLILTFQEVSIVCFTCLNTQNQHILRVKSLHQTLFLGARFLREESEIFFRLFQENSWNRKRNIAHWDKSWHFRWTLTFCDTWDFSR